MIPKELLQKIKKLEIKTRHIVNTTFSGEYHSVFKGQGINFAEVRIYQPGDDIRAIDWNVTAKTGVPHVKLFEEERELTVILAIDMSASNNFGSHDQTKAEIAAEIAAILGFSASRNKDKIGLLLFTDQIEHYIPPKKSKQHMMRILRDIFYFKPKNKKTSIACALDYLLKVNKKKAICFLISDFLDTNYEHLLRIAAKRFDLIPIVMEDPREFVLPRAGIVSLENPESGEMIMINTGKLDNRATHRNIIKAKKHELNRLFQATKLKPIKINCAQNYINPLSKYFRQRAKKILG
ncbi:DUF58 domain-containing protein [Candidatus Margulisiibacteriota bacterium]